MNNICFIDNILTDVVTLIFPGNRDKYVEQLDILDKKIENTLKDVKGKGFIIYHPSFGYFADDYDLEMIAVESHGKEATLAEELGGIIQKLSPLAPDYIANLEIIADTFKAVLK